MRGAVLGALRGVRDKANARVGRAGEYYMAHLIELNGLEAARVDGSCDLHVTLKSGRILRLEVKTATKYNRKDIQYYIGHSNAEIFALVNMINEPMIRLMSGDDVAKMNLSIRLKDKDFTPTKQDEDLAWLRSLE